MAPRRTASGASDEVPDGSAGGVSAVTSLRVENGHTVHAVETLEKLARALDVPMYRLFWDGDEPLSRPTQQVKRSPSSGEIRESHAGILTGWPFALGKMRRNDRDLILLMAYRGESSGNACGENLTRHHYPFLLTINPYVKYSIIVCILSYSYKLLIHRHHPHSPTKLPDNTNLSS